MRHRILPFILLALSAWVPIAHADDGVAPALDLDAFRGKVIYLDFWASWCAPCRRSFPWMNDMAARYADDGFVVVSVNVDAERPPAEAFLAQTPAHFPVIYDPAGEIAAAWQLMGMPSSFLIDRDGNVASRHVGFRSDSPQRYEAEIRALLNTGGHE